MFPDEILSSRNFDEVEIVDDETDSFHIARRIIKNKDEEDPFYVFDVGDIIKRHETLVSTMPRVVPFYAIKCNPHPTVIKMMAALNAGFDCASKREIEMVMASGAKADRIIFANTNKPNSHTRFAKEVGVDMLTVDSDTELYRIKDIFPEAKIVIRFRCDAKMAVVLGAKFGCDPDTVAPDLIKLAKHLGLNIYGLNFHVGSQCVEPAVYSKGIKIAVGLMEYASSLGIEGVKLLDIGGGFPSPDVCPIEPFAEVINEALEHVDPSIQVISEPGRYFVSSAFTLATCVTGKKIIDEGEIIRYTYCINDGIFGSFLNCALGIKQKLTPIPIDTSLDEEKQPSTILGPTSIAKDCIVPECFLPELKIGDWLLWPDMGAYSLARARTIGEIYFRNAYPFVKRKIWEKKISPQSKTLVGQLAQRSV